MTEEDGDEWSSSAGTAPNCSFSYLCSVSSSSLDLQASTPYLVTLLLQQLCKTLKDFCKFGTSSIVVYSLLSSPNKR